MLLKWLLKSKTLKKSTESHVLSLLPLQAPIAIQTKKKIMLKRKPEHNANVSVESDLTRLKDSQKRLLLPSKQSSKDKKKKKDLQQLPGSKIKRMNVTDLLKLLRLRLNTLLKSTKKSKRQELLRKSDWLKKLKLRR